MHSDRATNFVGAATALRKCFENRYQNPENERSDEENPILSSFCHLMLLTKDYYGNEL